MKYYGYNVLPIIQQRTEMHKDIQLTKMDIAYEELIYKIKPLLEEHLEKYGQAYALYAMQQMAIEFSGRHLLSMKALVADDKRELAVQEFLGQTISRAADLLDEAVQAGIAKKTPK